MIYQFSPGAQISGHLDPQVVGERLNALGTTDPDAIVEYARPGDSPIHAAFTWDDTVAAASFRRDEARHLVRAVVMVREDAPARDPIRAFVSVVERDSGERRYMSIVTAMSDDDYRVQIIQRALDEAVSWRRRYQDIEEFARVFYAIDRTYRRLHVKRPARKPATGQAPLQI